MATIAVTGKTSKKPSGPYWYWTELGPEKVNLTNRTVHLPPGNYVVFWDFRGNPGDALEFTLEASGNQLVKVPDQIPPGELDGWGEKPFTVAPAGGSAAIAAKSVFQAAADGAGA